MTCFLQTYLLLAALTVLTYSRVSNRRIVPSTLESGIDVGQGINVGPGKLGKKNKRRALNTHVLCSE